jgi:type IV pilus assembly protein PilM
MVRKIILGGGSSKIPQMKETIQDKSGAVVEIVNPFRNVLYSERDFDPEYILDIAPKMGVAVGLALRRVDDR